MYGQILVKSYRSSKYDVFYGLHDDSATTLGLSFPVMGIPFGEHIAAYSGHDDDVHACRLPPRLRDCLFHVVNDEGLLSHVRSSTAPQVRGGPLPQGKSLTPGDLPSGYRVRLSNCSTLRDFQLHPTLRSVHLLADTGSSTMKACKITTDGPDCSQLPLPLEPS